MINHAFVDVRRHGKQLLAAAADAGGTAPKSLTDLVDTVDAITAPKALADPIAGLLKSVMDGQLRGDKLDAAIAGAAAAQQTTQFRAELRQHVDLAATKKFIAALQNGAADQIIDSLRPGFDTAAKALAKIAERIDPNIDAEQFLSTTDETGRKAWQSINTHVTVLNKIGSCVIQFGAKSSSWSLLEIPANLHGGHSIHDLALLCVDPERDPESASRVFHQHGQHRRSPWYLAASAGVLKLNSIAEARESVRAWAKSAWAAMDLNQGRGRMDPDKGFVATPIPNPYAARR